MVGDLFFPDYSSGLLPPKERRQSARVVYDNGLALLRAFGHEVTENQSAGCSSQSLRVGTVLGKDYVWMQTYGFIHAGDRPLPWTKIEIWEQVDGKPNLLYTIGRRKVSSHDKAVLKTINDFDELNKLFQRISERFSLS